MQKLKGFTSVNILYTTSHMYAMWQRIRTTYAAIEQLTLTVLKSSCSESINIL